MQLHTLQPKYKSKKKKRVGRGGARGTYSGRGQKGQRAHAGRRVPSSAIDVIKNIPKLRGIKHSSIKAKPKAISLGLLNGLGEDLISRIILEKKGVIKKGEAIKILNSGVITKPISIKGIGISTSAKEAIEKAGGSVK